MTYDGGSGHTKACDTVSGDRSSVTTGYMAVTNQNQKD